MTERQLELRETRRERQVILEERATRKPDAPNVPLCRVLMANGEWKVPKQQRPKLAPPPKEGFVPFRGPDQRRTMLPKQPGTR